MTVSSTTNKAGPFACNGVIQAFPFTFPFLELSDIEVWLLDPAAETEIKLVYGTAFTVSAPGTGGTVTTVAVYPTGKQILIKRVLPVTQEIDLQNQGDWFPEVHEEAFDRSVMLLQQQQEQLDRGMLQTESGLHYDAQNKKIINLANGTAASDAVNLGQMQAGDTATYGSAVSAAFAAMVAWVTNYIASYWPISTPISNPNLITPSSQTIAAGQTRIFFPVAIHGILLAFGGIVQAAPKDFTFTPGNNYVDLTWTPHSAEVVTAFIYTSAAGVTTFDHDYIDVPVGATSATMPGGAFGQGIVCFNGVVQRQGVDYTHAFGSAVINFTAPRVSDTTVTVIKI